jgi:dsRNA-specific ribonuclease
MIVFRVSDIRHLVEAVTHKSFANEHHEFRDNQRLEFIGDALLNFVIADILYRKYPNFGESQMTNNRKKIVSDKSLQQKMMELGFDKLLKLGIGESTLKHRSLNLHSDCFESIVGAIYYDANGAWLIIWIKSEEFDFVTMYTLKYLSFLTILYIFILISIFVNVNVFTCSCFHLSI